MQRINEKGFPEFVADFFPQWGGKIGYGRICPRCQDKKVLKLGKKELSHCSWCLKRIEDELDQEKIRDAQMEWKRHDEEKKAAEKANKRKKSW